MARAARKKFPYSIECKNQESVNIWKAYEQAGENSGDYEPIVVLKRNNTKPLVLVDADYFVRLHSELDHVRYREAWRDRNGDVRKDNES
jgi:hypothetical protein